MNFLSNIFLVVLGACALTFGVIGLFVNRFFKLLSPLCKVEQTDYHASGKANHIPHSKSSSSKKAFFDKQYVEEVEYEEMK